MAGCIDAERCTGMALDHYPQLIFQVGVRCQPTGVDLSTALVEYREATPPRYLHVDPNKAHDPRASRFPQLADWGAIQMGELQARSWMVVGKSLRGGTPARRASQVDQRQVGFSSTRA